ncbi:hypothetical protein PTSG_08191 [Salpingoeca rosetta]|uniref:PHD-type domain-containing protein n=1 Tax=Salpingoeca rosetta (strain ATCC 50818 / BSB-021) TaxID=946362 RepID=F2UI95_SALR5|nr:uncharacterized protein PTSG_08191 [Salpingoeca rosetta]EGD76844.1 hypothetical protein PTSG_08191 [Salpingoeca rosetta]|eukprot:XP_004991216.1 hypothetical protein PTSG_08191 [Salpingoeca rosetta]
MTEFTENSREYSSFNLGNVTFNCGDTILVKGASSMEYVADIVRVFTNNDRDVYVELKWFYRPEDLPGGRQEHHGAEEVLRSNHRDIVSARVVEGLCAVLPMPEYEERQAKGQAVFRDGQALPTFFWRSNYNVKTRKITRPPKKFCVCRRPYNPDKLMVCCDSCDSWYHAKCMGMNEEEALEPGKEWHCLKCIETGKVPRAKAEKLLQETEANTAVRTLAGTKKGEQPAKRAKLQAKKKKKKQQQQPQPPKTARRHKQKGDAS